MNSALRVSVAMVLAASPLGAAYAQSEDDWYVAAAGSLSLRGTAVGEIANAPAPGLTVQTENSFKTGYGTQLALGRSFDRFRIEGELGYTRDRQDSYAAISPPTGDIPADVEENNIRAMLNFYVDVPLGRISPYVGAGVGYSWTDIEFIAPRAPFPTEPPRVLIDDRDGGFARQLMGGVAFAVSDRVALTAQYRWLDRGDFEALDVRGEAVRRENRGHNVDFGLRVSL